MINKLEETIETNVLGSPYFVISDDDEKFYVVKSINLKDKLLKFFSDKEMGELILGRDIIEENTRGLRLSVEYIPNEIRRYTLVLAIIENCRKLARLGLFDYFGLEKIRGSTTKITSPGYAVIQPRLFRKVIDN